MDAAYLTAKELAQALGVCVDTIWRAARRGELSPTRIGRAWRFPRRLLTEGITVPPPKSTKPHARLMRML